MTMDPDDFSDDNGGDSTSNRSRIPDSIRKALMTGLSAVFMTEEGVRQAFSDLPKDAMGYLVQQTDRSRKELYRVVSVELKNFLKSVDLSGAVRKAFTGMKVEVNAEIKFTDLESDDADKAAKPTKKKRAKKAAK